MSKPRKTVLITDLDNTLFDWVQLWHDCFMAMMDKVVEISGVSFEELKPEIRAIHQRHGTSEYSFLLQEMPTLRARFTGKPLSDVFRPAFEAYRSTRRQNLRLYPTVVETLLKIKGDGAAVVGYTESMAFYSNYRIRRLGLDGVLDYVFSPEDHDVPEGITREEIRKYPPSHYTFRYTTHKHTPKGSLKPDPSVLLSIIAELKADSSECVYIGDSATRDVAMAQDAGVAEIFALYGRAQHTEPYQLLREVTHWSDLRVEHERQVDKRQVKASIILEHSFSEILDHFQFADWHGRETMGVIGGDAEKRKAVIDIWKKAVDVQMHFNDIEMKIRGLFVTIVLGLTAALGFLLNKGLSFSDGSLTVRYAIFMPLFGILATCLFYFMDRYWYHRLLLGAVMQGANIEKRYAKELPELALTARIGEASPVDTNKWKGVPGWLSKKIASLFVSDKDYRDHKRLRSDAKIELFYKPVGYLFFVVFVVTLFLGGVQYANKSIAGNLKSIAINLLQPSFEGAPSPVMSKSPSLPTTMPSAPNAQHLPPVQSK